MIRVLLADDHPVFAAGLRAVLDAEDDMTVTAVAATGEQALAAATAHPPDVAVLDIAMPGGDGLWVCASVRSLGLPCRVLVLTMSASDETVLAALRAGAQGYVLKDSDADEIVAAVRAVARGDALIGAGVAAGTLAHLANAATAAPFPQLTQREREVLRLLAAGCDNAMAARRLGVSTKTVRNNVSTILTKLHVSDRAAAIIRARDAGLT